MFVVQGDVAETAKTFFEESTVMPPAKNSTLSIAEVNTIHTLSLISLMHSQAFRWGRVFRSLFQNSSLAESLHGYSYRGPLIHELVLETAAFISGGRVSGSLDDRNQGRRPESCTDQNHPKEFSKRFEVRHSTDQT